MTSHKLIPLSTPATTCEVHPCSKRLHRSIHPCSTRPPPIAHPFSIRSPPINLSILLTPIDLSLLHQVTTIQYLPFAPLVVFLVLHRCQLLHYLDFAITLDKSWTKITNKIDPMFIKGAMAFAERGKTYVDSDGRMHCPCRNCVNARRHVPRVVASHIILNGFEPSYNIRIYQQQNFLPSVESSFGICLTTSPMETHLRCFESALEDEWRKNKSAHGKIEYET
ncbi:hypothetical protein E3N88_29149 [Mikania micrantha]|uniref:Transposase-associated domain-containing protein n=1 Tax=Mikania micrantha TaxID=192012 RepID=A0A5N6MIL5_9ASTR|nr:hypothetical protein E3N88_29149 [Mikania micrantha]